MRKKFLSGIAAVAVASVAAVNVNYALQDRNLSALVLANMEALSQDEGSTKWFSNLNWVECPISKVNGAAGFYLHGVWIAAYATYTVYGNKKVCERELTTNTCNTANQTPCSE
jgi:hypothetical protein